jgi:hypothetical protein
MNLTNKIIEIAKSYIGQEEIRENVSFKDPIFLTKMQSVGWFKGAPWCAFLAKLVWEEAFKIEDTKGYDLVRRYSSGSTIETYHNYKASKEFHASDIPVLGAIVIYQEGNSTFGHAGIVVEITDNTHVKNLEGNTNTDGSREGYITALKTRLIKPPHSDYSLNLLGYINPTRIA